MDKISNFVNSAWSREIAFARGDMGESSQKPREGEFQDVAALENGGPISGESPVLRGELRVWGILIQLHKYCDVLQNLRSYVL